MIESNEMPGCTEEMDGPCGPSVSVSIETETTHCAADFLRNLFQRFDESAVRYSVLHSWDLLPDELHSDLDIIVNPADTARIFPVFEEMKGLGYRPILILNYFTNAYRFDFAWFEEGRLVTANVDLICEDRRNGLLIAAGEPMLRGRQRLRKFWIVTPEIEFRYVLAKKTWKQKVSAAQSARLGELARQIGATQTGEIARELFLKRQAKRVASDCMNGTLGESKLISGGRRELWKRAFLSPLQLMRYAFQESLRLFRRWREPAGLFVAVLGPDGAGKSTLIDGITNIFGDVLRSSQKYHWRPRFLDREKFTVATTDPHGRSPRGSAMSMIFLTFFFIDSWLGYLFLIRPQIARLSFIVFDRYFHDVLVDPLRYRYGGPSWFAKLLSRFVPEPDVVIQLDADEQLIFSRKPELSRDEIRRQRFIYDQLSFQHAKKVTVRTDAGIEACLHSSVTALVDFMGLRFDTQTCAWRAMTR